MATEAGDVAVVMGAVGLGDAGAKFIFAGFRAGAGHQLGAGRLGVEIRAGTIDRILDQRYPPFQLWIDNRSLNQDAASAIVDPFKAAFTIGVAKQAEISSARTSRRAGGLERRCGINRSVAILAADFHGISDFTVNEAIAVTVLREMAIGALETLFGMDIHHMDGFAWIGADRNELRLTLAAKFLGIVVGDDMGGVGPIGRHIATGIEQIALTVALENAAEIPTVAVIVGELGVLIAVIHVIDVADKFRIGPFAANRGTFRVALQRLMHLGRSRIHLLFGPHPGSVGLIVPHGVAEIGIQEDIRLVHVAVHALGGWDRPGELMSDRVAAFLFGDGRIGGRGLAVPAEFRPGQAVARLPVIGIDHMAGGAAGTAIVPLLIIGAHEPGERVIEAGFVDVENWHGNPQPSSGAPV